jgi:hypothetical protein
MDPTAQMISAVLSQWGPPGVVVVGCLAIIKYLLDDKKDMISAHKAEIAEERQKTAAREAEVSRLRDELLSEARSNGDLAESVRQLLEKLVTAENH